MFLIAAFGCFCLSTVLAANLAAATPFSPEQSQVLAGAFLP
jgi:hypothetical protein